MATNQTELIRGFSSKFWWLKSTNNVKFTKEYMMCTEKHVLLKNGRNIKWAKPKFAIRSQSEKKKSNKCKHIDSPVNKMFRAL